jgi:hypothetical protein
MTEPIRNRLHAPVTLPPRKSTNRVPSHSWLHSRLNRQGGLTRRSPHPPLSDIPNDLLHSLANIRRSSCTHIIHHIERLFLAETRSRSLQNARAIHVLLPEQPLLQHFISLSSDHDSLLACLPLPQDLTSVGARRAVSTQTRCPSLTSGSTTYPKQTAKHSCTTCKVGSFPSTVSSLVNQPSFFFFVCAAFAL